MKIPLSPPTFVELIKTLSAEELSTATNLIKPTTPKGEYIHWDKLRHLSPPSQLSNEKWWACIKLARKAMFKSLPFKDKRQQPFVYALTDTVLNKLHQIDRKAGLHGDRVNHTLRNDYLVHSLMEEAITSSQLEGASTTRKVAKEMLRTKRKPKDLSEQMIFNNFNAMQFIREIKQHDLSKAIILELHQLLTEETMDDEAEVGAMRESNDILIWDNTNQVLHTPPDYNELAQRLKTLCQFANTDDAQEDFIHPVIKAIIMHFMLAYDHPFTDGNGRTARALFYWSLAHDNYSLMEFISISHVLKQSPNKYAKSYLLTETDENDLTYYILYQLDVILEAISNLEQFANQKVQAISEVEQLLNDNTKFRDQLNYRQVDIIKHALQHPNTHYKIEGHRKSHKVTYDTARTDLLKLEELGLMQKMKTGKSFTFKAANDLKALLQR